MGMPPMAGCFFVDDTLLPEEDMPGATNILKRIAVGSNDVGEWADEESEECGTAPVRYVSRKCREAWY
jgi:hypothetical protein